MILYNAIDVKIGNGADEVIEVRHGSDVVWSREADAEGIWTFNNPTAGDTITLTATFAGNSAAFWGDGNSNDLTSDTSTTHTY